MNEFPEFAGQSFRSPHAAIPEGEQQFLYYYNQRSRRIFELIRSSEFPDLTHTDGLILHALNAHSHGNHGVQIRPSMTLVARETGVNRSTVKRSLRKTGG
jgi:AraC-like DNA-binding protein